MAEETNKKKYLDYDGLKTVVENVIEYTDSSVEQKSQVQIVESGETEVLSTLEIYKMTQEEYDKAVEDGTIVENAIYLTPEEDIDLSPYATIDQLKDYAQKNHSHSISDVKELQSKLDEKVSTSRTINGKALTSDITLSASDVGADISGSAEIQVLNHNISTDSHSDIRVLIQDLTTKLNNFLDVDDTTSDELSEVLQLIENNKGTLESLTITKVNVSDIIDNLETSMTDKVLSAKQGVAIKGLIDNLQSNLTTHKNDKTNPHNVTLTQLGVSATASELNVLDGVTVTTEELNYVDGVTSAIQTQLDSKSALGHVHTDVHYTKEEVDEFLSQKSQVQIITWEADD